MIYLIGCRHIQNQTFFPRNGLLSGQRNFKAFISGVIRKYKISLVAEELDSDYFERTKRRSVALDLANELSGIEHRFCDPCPLERTVLGIDRGLPIIDDPFDPALSELIQNEKDAHMHDIGHRWPVREDFWIKQLGGDLHRDVLFICGALHVCTFGSRLRARETETRVIRRFFERPRYWLKSKSNAIEFAALKEVLRDGGPPQITCPCVGPKDRE